MQAENKNRKLASEESEIDLLELVMHLRQKILYIIIGLVVGVLIAGVVTEFGMTPFYTATAKMYMVSASSDSVINLTDLNIGTNLSTDYVEMMKIYPIYEEVNDSLSLNYTYNQMISKVSISNISNTRIVNISVTSDDPREAAEIANAWAKASRHQLPDLMSTSEPSFAEKARIPEHPSGPSFKKNVVMGGAAGAMLVVAFLTVLFLLDDTVKTAEDVEKEFGFIPLSVIPQGEIESLSDKVEHKGSRRHRLSKRLMKKIRSNKYRKSYQASTGKKGGQA